MIARPNLAAVALLASACSGPLLTRDGQLVFTEAPEPGAIAVTAFGVERWDRGATPAPVTRRSAFEPHRPPTGFLLPPDGILRDTSRPVAIASRGVSVVVRASDRWVPAWGGEILMRIDVLVPRTAHPAARASSRTARRLVLVVDAAGGDALPLIDRALSGLGDRDRVALVSARGTARVVVPLVPGGHRTLLLGAAERVLAPQAASARKLGRALALARQVGGKHAVDVLVVTDGWGVATDRGAVAQARRRAASSGCRVLGVASDERGDAELLSALGGRVGVGAIEERLAFLDAALSPPGDVVVRDLVLSFSGAPAPVRVLETSAGFASLDLEADHWHMGALSVGEGRTEVVRLLAPAWTAGEPFRIDVVTVHADAQGRRHRARGKVVLRYSDDISLLAAHRHGDVLAYASALAMVRRLERAFLGGDLERLGGLTPWVRRQSRSLAMLARERQDPALARQAEVLSTLLAFSGG